MCARVGNQQSRGVVTARVRTDVVRSLHHQRQDLHQSTYPVPLERSGLILLSGLVYNKVVLLDFLQASLLDSLQASLLSFSHDVKPLCRKIMQHLRALFKNVVQ
jgi:hypothetical protein